MATFQFVSYPAVLSGGGGGGGSVTPVQEFAGAGGTIVGAVNNVNTVFTLSNLPSSSASVEVYLDGLFQRQTIDYTIVGAVITFAVAPTFGQFVDVYYTK